MSDSTIENGRVIVVKTQTEFDKALSGSTGAVALEFVQKDCGYCEDEKPQVDALAAKCGSLTVLRVDIDDLPAVADKFLTSEDAGTPTIFYAKSAADLTPEKAKELEDSDALRRKIKCAVK